MHGVEIVRVSTNPSVAFHWVDFRIFLGFSELLKFNVQRVSSSKILFLKYIRNDDVFTNYFLSLSFGMYDNIAYMRACYRRLRTYRSDYVRNNLNKRPVCNDEQNTIVTLLLFHYAYINRIVIIYIYMYVILYNSRQTKSPPALSLRNITVLPVNISWTRCLPGVWVTRVLYIITQKTLDSSKFRGSRENDMFTEIF